MLGIGQNLIRLDQIKSYHIPSVIVTHTTMLSLVHLLIILIYTIRASIAFAAKDDCGGACQLALSHVSFPDVNASLGYYQTQCGSHLRVVSLYVCIRQYCNNASRHQDLRELDTECERYANITLPPFEIVDNITSEIVAEWPLLDQERWKGTYIKPVLVSNELFDLALRSKRAWTTSEITRSQYGNAMFWFWGIVIAIGFLDRLLSSRSHSSFPRTLHASPSSRLISMLHLWTKKHITIPSAFSTKSSEPYWELCVVPPRLPSFLLVLFLLLNIVLCCIGYEVFAENLIFNTTEQWLRYIADRTGVISNANLSIIWLFATRNNVVLCLTGWSFETVMQFHRWTARVSTIEAVVHSICYTVLVFEEGSWQRFWAEFTLRYWNMGVLATVAMTLICCFSLYPMRRYYYELFLVLHIGLGVLTLLGMWYHVEIFDGQYNWCIWPCLIIWLADRVLRSWRLITLNRVASFSAVEYDSKSNVVSLQVPVSTAQRPQAGQYYFLYFLNGLAFYESHPFTVSSWKAADTLIKPNVYALEFLIRPYNGFTKKLADAATGPTTKPSGRVRVLAEGPYGPAHNLKKFDSLVFVVGGTGIAIALAYLTSLHDSTMTSKSPYRARRIHIVWAVQTAAFFEHIFHSMIEPRLRELACASCRETLKIELDIYVTRTKAMDTTLPDMTLPDMTLPGIVKLSVHHNTRPEIDTLVCEATCWRPRPSDLTQRTPSDLDVETQTLLDQARSCRIAVVACGPGSLSDATRAAVVRALGRDTSCDLEFFNESYSW